jgi:hypothetical protein
MHLNDLVNALARHDDLVAREWVKDARRTGLRYSELPRPTNLDADRLAIAAGIVELLASRQGEAPPDWTSDVGPASREIWLSQYAEKIPVLRERCRQFGPAPLRKRHVLALPDALTIP